uniref:Uncharacterized protein n=1 Tax=Octactis speculum TaxID=3111310 RepID=A0A7S2HNS7_9STRA|mmetsp:Transcript_8162/g.10277  ORF Transcript_8162/g.10277 Transcript_8162/m.10277 type:complete len:314 (+) Transcript_8162:125-1066(+)
MRFTDRPFIMLHALALTMIVVHGNLREADALIHKSKLPQTKGPSSAAKTAWSERMSFPHPHRQPTNRVRPTTSLMLNMVQGNIDVQKFPQKTMSKGVVLASMLTVAVLWKTKAASALLPYPAWFLSNVLYKPYQNSLVNNPLITKVITGAVLAIVGDAVAQATSDEVGFDRRRAVSFAAFDACYRFFQHYMFPVIIGLGQGNVVKHILPAFLIPAAAAMEQTALYQFGIIPILYYPIFFSFTGFIQGLSIRQAWDRMKLQFFPCWRRNLMFWIPTQLCLFGIVADKWQIPFACVMGMLWSMILSKTAGKTKKR